MVRAYRRPRGVVPLLVVCMLSLGPFAQGVDAGLEIGTEMVMMDDVEPPASIVQPDAGELLSNIDGFFTENLGQKGEGAGLYYCQGSPLSVSFGVGWVAYDYRPDGYDECVLFQASFVDANPVAPQGLEPLPHKNNYFIGNEPYKWVIGAGNYRKVEYSGIYDGIDLTFSLSQGMLKYDFMVHPGYDPSVIKVYYCGIQGLHIDGASGDLLIETPIGTLRDTAPYSYQDGPEGREVVESSIYIEDGSTMGFLVDQVCCDLPLVIDPGLDFSTYIGGSDKEYPYGIFIDNDDNILIAGFTKSTDFPTTTGSYDPTWNNNELDGFALKLIDNGTKLAFATYVGGDSFCSCTDIEVDSKGNVIIAGHTGCSDFPTTADSFQSTIADMGDAFVLGLNGNGSKVEFCTYFGGSESDYCRGLEIGPNGDIYICGGTLSTNLPAVSGSYDSSYNGKIDSFVARLNHNLTKAVYATYVGGSDEDFPRFLADNNKLYVDDDGCAYVASYTRSNDFPTTSGAISTSLKGANDGYVFKLSSDGKRLLGSTLLGGSDSDYARTVTVDPFGYIYVVGRTSSNDFPTTSGAYDTSLSGESDGFLVKINSTFKKLEYGTYIGGSDYESCFYIDIDALGDPWLIGVTDSDDFPTTDDCYDDTMNDNDFFITSIDLESDTLKYSTFLGGNGVEYWVASLDISNNSLALTGYTTSADYPTTTGAFDTTFNGNIDSVVTRFLLDPVNGTPPTPPQNLTAKAGIRSIDLSWEPPEDNGGLWIRGYKVFRGTSDDSLQFWDLVGRGITASTDMTCECGRTYYYAVKAINFMGESNLSNIANSTTFGTPTEPVNPTVTPGCGSVLISWELPLDLGGIPLLGYHLFRSESSDPYQLVSIISNKTDYLDTGLQNGNEYSYYLQAFNAMGTGMRSNIVTAMPIGPPTEPRYVQISSGDAQIELEWRAPVNDGGSSITGYNVLRGLTESSMEVHRTVEYSIITSKDTGLTNGVTYFYAIRAFNAIGDGPLSAIVNATPLGLPGAPIDIKIEAGDGHVILSWELPETTGGTDIMRYQIFRGASEDSLSSLDYTSDGEITTYTDSVLMNGQTLYYAVCAVNMVGDGPWTEVVSATPLAFPDPPGDLVAIAGNGMVTISWTRPQNNGGAEITQYRIFRGTTKDDLELLATKAKSIFIYDDSDVVVGTTYYYAVAAVTVAGEGPKSIIASATPYGPPGLPVSLEATPGNRKVRLTWSAPEDDGASPIEGYVILRGTSPASLREIAQLGDVASYMDTSVTNDQTYYYAIAAINKAGPGDYTDPLPATPFKPATAPGKVTTLVTGVKGAKVTLQWTAPQDDGGSPVTGYIILRGLAKDSLEQIAEVGPGVTTWSEDGLERGTTYFYSVAAKNDVGEGEPILAREVKVEKKKDEGPGFEVLAVVTAMMLVIPMIRRRG